METPLETPDPSTFCHPPIGTVVPLEEPKTTHTRLARIAQNAEDLGLIGELRYKLFIERDKKKYLHANHVLRTFIEPVDHLSANLMTEQDGKCFASVRITEAKHGHLDEQLTSLIVNGSKGLASNADMLLFSRLAIREDPRALGHVVSLFRLTSELLHQHRNAVCFAYARPTLSSLFVRFGFHPTGTVDINPVAGPLVLYRLDLRSEDHHSNFVTINKYQRRVSR